MQRLVHFQDHVLIGTPNKCFQALRSQVKPLYCFILEAPWSQHMSKQWHQGTHNLSIVLGEELASSDAPRHDAELKRSKSLHTYLEWSDLRMISVSGSLCLIPVSALTLWELSLAIGRMPMSLLDCANFGTSATTPPPLGRSFGSLYGSPASSSNDAAEAAPGSSPRSRESSRNPTNKRGRSTFSNSIVAILVSACRACKDEEVLRPGRAQGDTQRPARRATWGWSGIADAASDPSSSLR
eukprot:CAMPEP_0206607020 /NCGR_PEP_ID=MMETSP0325_2-20121206/51824_1 /ASSEMBLY_ACC=CAM_ASM_000347 /TAXON_ID=2866 /ORGANISM="Crypthecodinium cohnii, Strain Seligo" /LENGTH=239 /DNA_ID=CAMNT_0054123799 /DNA_START=214 /DNA_END=934 /DNA_ORIENTATION=+